MVILGWRLHVNGQQRHSVCRHPHSHAPPRCQPKYVETRRNGTVRCGVDCREHQTQGSLIRLGLDRLNWTKNVVADDDFDAGFSRSSWVSPCAQIGRSLSHGLPVRCRWQYCADPYLARNYKKWAQHILPLNQMAMMLEAPRKVWH